MNNFPVITQEHINDRLERLFAPIWDLEDGQKFSVAFEAFKELACIFVVSRLKSLPS